MSKNIMSLTIIILITMLTSIIYQAPIHYSDVQLLFQEHVVTIFTSVEFSSCCEDKLLHCT